MDTLFTQEEQKQIKEAMYNTWQVIGQDVVDACNLGGEILTKEAIIETVLDAGYIIHYGPLPKDMYAKICNNYPEVKKWAMRELRF